jgi:hypothetical protein
MMADRQALRAVSDDRECTLMPQLAGPAPELPPRGQSVQEWR